MPIEQLALPTLATVALGTALLMPLRDDRRGKRATLAGAAPLRTEFSVIDGDRAIAHDAPEVDHVPDGPASTDDERDEAARNAALDVLARPSPPALPSPDRLDGRAYVTSLATTIARVLGIGSPARITASRACEATAEVVDVASQEHPTRDEDSAPAATTFASVLQRAVLRTQASATGEATHREPASRIATIVAQSETETETVDVPASIVALQAPLVDRTASDDPAPLVVRAHRPTVERVVPLTRLPLRPQTATVSWPTLLAPSVTVDAGALVRDRSTRHAALVELSRSADDDATHALRVAYREEDCEGRSLALRALGRTTIDDSTREIVLDALRAGSDDERSLAVDIVARTGDRDALRCALTDRLDAIAARAALAYVDSLDRDDYVAKLAPHVEPARLDAILGLLAGVVE